MPLKTIPDRDICDPAADTGLQPLPPGILPGALVDVRGGRWEVDATVPRQDCHELRLSGAREPQARVLLWPFDRPVAAGTDAACRLKVVRLRRWRRIAAGFIAADLDPATPRGRASADVLEYQLAPAVAAACGESRLLLADEVGLGKTIQAGWILADCLARADDARILVAVPAGLRRQWDAELRRFFGIEPAMADAAWLRRRVQSLPPDMNPWAPPGVYLASIDFLKRPDLLPSLEPLIWDLVVIDEAHMAMAPTDRHAAVRRIAARARQVVTITATPFSGDAAGFASMAALGGDDPPLMFRRSREDTGDRRARRHRFATVALTNAERQLQQMLERYSREVWTAAKPSGADNAARLAVTILRKRALSSPAAAVRSFTKRLELLRHNDPAPRQLSLLDDEDEIGAEDDLPAAALGAPGLADAGREHRVLQALVAAAGPLVHGDSKERHLGRLLRRIGGEPTIVFTEYRDTLLHLADVFQHALLLHGGLSPSERAVVQTQFTEKGGLLLATDAASCGLNLQGRCRIVVNYELPWNPARLEQRIGRVDRIGQRRTVHAVTLVARHTAEDLVIAPLTRRLQRVASTLGQRDRLAAFLTDARTAGIVIGGAPDAVSEDPMPVTRQAAGLSELTSAAARQLRETCTMAMPRQPQASAIAVSSIPASASLPEGILTLVNCTAATIDGFFVARRTLLLHLSGAQPRPHTPREVRKRIEATSAFVTEEAGTLASATAAEWFTDVGRFHQLFLDRRIEREQALLARRTSTEAIQPGLFDTRVIRQFETSIESENDVDARHRERIGALERMRELRLECRPAAVLVAWR
jgi:superfamily II DNA or RNA helicase